MRPVDLDGACRGRVRARSIRRPPDGPVRVRVLAGIDGLDPAQPLAPPEICFGLDRPVWRDLQGSVRGVAAARRRSAPEDSVIALETNPALHRRAAARLQHPAARRAALAQHQRRDRLHAAARLLGARAHRHRRPHRRHHRASRAGSPRATSAIRRTARAAPPARDLVLVVRGAALPALPAHGRLPRLGRARGRGRLRRRSRRAGRAHPADVPGPHRQRRHVLRVPGPRPRARCCATGSCSRSRRRATASTTSRTRRVAGRRRRRGRSPPPHSPIRSAC